MKENPVKEFRSPENAHRPAGLYMHQAALAVPEFKVEAWTSRAGWALMKSDLPIHAFASQKKCAEWQVCLLGEQ